MKKLMYNPGRRTAMLFENGKLKCGFSGPRAFSEFLKACTEKDTEVAITDEGIKITHEMANFHDDENIWRTMAAMPQNTPIIAYVLSTDLVSRVSEKINSRINE